MKRILLLSFLLISIFSFSQSEIWGIKQQAGKNNGGYLFSIDSATNKITEHQYFANNSTFVGKSEIYYDSTLKCMFGISNQILYKYDLVNRTTESRLIAEEVIGSFVKASNGYLYALERNGILKINPQDLSQEKVDGFKGQFVLPDSTVLFNTEIGTSSCGLYQVSDDQLVVSNYVQDDSYSWQHNFIYSINTNTDSIELIYRTSSFPENEYLIPLGKFYPYNGLLYAMFSINDEIALYSLNMLTNEFTCVHIFHEFGTIEDIIPYTISSDGKLYGRASVSSSGVPALFQYDISNDGFQILSDELYGNLPHTRMITDSKNDLYLVLDTFIEHYTSTSFYKYNFETHQLDSLFYINTAYYDLPHYDDIGPLCTFKDGFISLTDTKDGAFNHIVFYNTEQRRLDTIASLLSTLKYTDSLNFPDYYCETAQGNLLFLKARIESNSDSTYLGHINLSEFNTQSKIFTKKFEFEIVDFNALPTLLHLKNDLFFISCSVNSFIIYNGKTNEVQEIPMPIPNYGRWIKKSESSLIFSSFSSGIFRYEIGSSELEPIYQPNGDTIIEKTSLYMGNKLLIHTNPGDKLQCLNLESNDLSPILSYSELFDDISQMGVQNLFAIDEYIYLAVERSLFKKIYRYNPDTQELILIQGVYYSAVTEFNIIENYSQDGFYITDGVGAAESSLVTLKQVLNTENSATIVDNFEFIPNGIFSDISSYSPFVKAKKKPIHQWIGTVDNDWYETGNWSNGLLPNDSSSVNITNSATYWPMIDTIVALDNLYIYDEAKINLDTNAQLRISGDFKSHGLIKMLASENKRSSLIIDGEFIQKGIQKYIYYSDSIIGKTLASPMKAVEKYVQPFYSEAAFNEITFAFDEVQFYPQYSETCQAIQYTCQDTLLEFKGSFNHGLQNLLIPLLSEPELYPLANPYPSSFNWNKTQTTSLSHQACYFYNQEENTISATVDGIGNHPPFIRPLEVFWVYGNGEESIQIDHSALMHEQDYEEETSDKKVLSLQVSGAKKTDQTMIAFNDLASKNYDPKLDAFKFIKNENYPHIFTKAEEELLMINQHPDTTMMNLFVQMGEDGNMGIKLADNHGFDYLVLEDLIWHTRTDLLENDYQFDYFTSDGHYPFKLYFKPWVLEPIEEADIQMYYYPEFLVVKSRKQVKQADITFYDLAGRVVLEFSEQNFFHIEKPIDIPAGHYIVQFRSGDVVINKKILVR